MSPHKVTGDGIVRHRLQPGRPARGQRSQQQGVFRCGHHIGLLSSPRVIAATWSLFNRRKPCSLQLVLTACQLLSLERHSKSLCIDLARPAAPAGRPSDYPVGGSAGPSQNDPPATAATYRLGAPSGWTVTVFVFQPEPQGRRLFRPIFASRRVPTGRSPRSDALLPLSEMVFLPGELIGQRVKVPISSVDLLGALLAKSLLLLDKAGPSLKWVGFAEVIAHAGLRDLARQSRSREKCWRKFSRRAPRKFSS